MKITLIILLILQTFLHSCTTSTQTTNAIHKTENVAAVAFGGLPTYPTVKHQVQISGAVLCNPEEVVSFKKLRVDFFDGDKLVAFSEVDEFGQYSKTYVSREGGHTAKLALKGSTTYLDSFTFTSNSSVDRFSQNFKVCK